MVIHEIIYGNSCIKFTIINEKKFTIINVKKQFRVKKITIINEKNYDN